MASSNLTGLPAGGAPADGDPLLTTQSGNSRKVTVAQVRGVGATAPQDVDKSAASAGASSETARVDHKHDVSTAAPGTVSVSAAAEGSATSLARSDHNHAVSTAAPAQGVGGGSAEGSATSLARSDHDHAIRETGGPTDLTVGAVADGEIVARSGSSLVGHDLTPTEATATGDAQTTSATDVLMSGMTLTPGAGDYLAFFSGSFEHTTNTESIEVSLYVGGVQVAHTERRFTRGSGNSGASLAFQAHITGVGGADAVEVRWRTSAASASVHERTLTLLPLP